MITPFIEAKLEALKTMGRSEALGFRDDVINSLLDNPTRSFIYDRIDERLAVLNVVIANKDEPIEIEDSFYGE